MLYREVGGTSCNVGSSSALASCDPNNRYAYRSSIPGQEPGVPDGVPPPNIRDFVSLVFLNKPGGSKIST